MQPETLARDHGSDMKSICRIGSVFSSLKTPLICMVLVGIINRLLSSNLIVMKGDGTYCQGCVSCIAPT